MFILAYVNLPKDETNHHDRSFKTFGELVAWVEKQYPNYTSYSVTVLPGKGRSI